MSGWERDALERVRAALARYGVSASDDDVRAAAELVAAAEPAVSGAAGPPSPLRWPSPDGIEMTRFRAKSRAGAEDREEIARRVESTARYVQREFNCYVQLPRARAMLTSTADGPLSGAPIAIKDIVAQAGVPMTCGGSGPPSLPRADSTVVRRLREAGALLAGRTSMHEYAYGISNDNPHTGPARNPWDPARIPGGSSGGSAIAVATGCAFGAIGTDTGGSIRVPAALCGVAGFKPTYDAVSRAGVFPLAWSLDHVGPLARSAADAATVFDAIAHRPSRRGRARSMRALRVGVLESEYWARCSTGVAACFYDAVASAKAAGAHVRPIATRCDAELAEIGSVILLAEASMVHRHRLARRGAQAYGRDVRVRLLAGLAIAAVDYASAVARRRDLARAWVRDVFERADVVVTPTTPLAAARIGDDTVEIGAHRADAREAFTRFTRPFNALGIPALSVPCGFVAGLPVGLQIVGPPWADGVVLDAGIAYERTRGTFPSPRARP